MELMLGEITRAIVRKELCVLRGTNKFYVGVEVHITGELLTRDINNVVGTQCTFLLVQVIQA